MNYSEDKYVPELGGIYAQNKIIVIKDDLAQFILKYKLGLYFRSSGLVLEMDTMRKLLFYMNLLNFNECSSWQAMMLTSTQFQSINRIIYYSVQSQKSQRYIIYRDI
jgi:hypothetical protein